MTARASSALGSGLGGFQRNGVQCPQDRGATISDGGIPGAERAQLPGVYRLGCAVQRDVSRWDFSGGDGSAEREQRQPSGGGDGFQTNSGVKFSGHAALQNWSTRPGRA